MNKIFSIFIILAVGALPAAARPRSVDFGGNMLSQAHSALQAGQASKALSLLQLAPQSGPDAAEADNIECRVRFSLQQWGAAAKACAQAVRLDGKNSNYHMWLGRALGEQAATATFLNAYSLGKQARQEFETAARLDPRNSDALSDLGEFYVEAPSVVGGGLDKAEAVARELDKFDPVSAAQLRGRIAAARKDFSAAEQDYKQAIALSSHPARAWATLASYYRSRKQWQQMLWAAQNCAEAAARDAQSGVALFNGASVLIQANQDSELAAKMLENYLNGPSKTEEGPAFLAHAWLARLKMQSGDAAGAQQEQSAARALAGEHVPQKEMGR